MSLLKEFSKGGLQADLKTSDGSTAGSQDMTSKPVDVGFSLMRNMINTDGQVTGSDVNDYLERAQDLNDEVESVGFAIETDDGDIIKIYVNAQEADTFEQEMSKLLGMEGDIEEAINQLAQKFDIVDVVWPRDPEGDGEQDPDAELSIDDDGDVFAGTEPETPPSPEDGSVLPADDDAPVDGEPAASGDEAPTDGDEPPAEGAVDDEGFEDIPRTSDAPADDEVEDIPRASADDASADAETTDDAPDTEAEAEVDADADAAADTEDDEAEMEPVLNDDGSQKLDKDGEPVMRKKKKEKAKEPSLDDLPSGDEVKTEGLLRAFTRESVRDDIVAHVREVEARGNKGKYQIMATVSGGVTGRRTAPLKKNGEIAFFDTEEAAKTEADRLTKHMNRAGATASYSYVPKLVEAKQLKETTMTIGSNFLSRLAEAKGTDADAVKDGMNIPLDTQHQQLVVNLKKPIEKKIIALFAMAGVIGRLLKAEPDVEDRVRAAADMLRKNADAKNAFTAFYNALANAKGYGIKVEKKDPHTEPKRGASVQQKFEAVMVALGLPESLITTSGPSPVGTYVNKTAKLIDQGGDLQTLLNNLANKLGVRGASAPEDRVKVESVIGRQFKARLDELDGAQSNDPYVKDVLALLRALGVPEENLAFKKTALIGSLRMARDKLKSRQMVDTKIEQLMNVISSQQKAEQPAAQAAPARTMGKGPAMKAEGLVMEAFGELEALTSADLKHFNMLEPADGPAMMASYSGGSQHEETVLAVGVDPDVEGYKTLRVGIDGPWDGSLHAKYFTNDKDGYKAALAYANMLKTANLKTGGRPKGWK